MTDYWAKKTAARLGWIEASSLWDMENGRAGADRKRLAAIAASGETFLGMDYRSFRKIAEHEGFESVLHDRRDRAAFCLLGRRGDGLILTAGFREERLTEAVVRGRRIGQPFWASASAIAREEDEPTVAVTRIQGRTEGPGPFGYATEFDCTSGLRLKLRWIDGMFGEPSREWWSVGMGVGSYESSNCFPEATLLTYREKPTPRLFRGVRMDDRCQERSERLPSYWYEALDIGRRRAFADILPGDAGKYDTPPSAGRMIHG